MSFHTLAPWVYFIVATHLTNICTTIYLHRGLSHGGLEVRPMLAVPMRIWIWLTTAVTTREWVAIHRKHHVYTDREGDPHSPKIFGARAVVLTGWWLYHQAAKDVELLEKYGKGCPDDWLERKILTPHPLMGPMLLTTFNLIAFGWGVGALLTLGQMLWMPICGDIINGLGHLTGYRNTDTKDTSRNIIPWGIIMAGEELHNNHHADPRSPKFRRRWFELDLGWVYVRLFSVLGGVRVLTRHSSRNSGLHADLGRVALDT
jgi:stearoyl-CoA desaturase (delta-9 desaturase)